jgi:hypothetical protein
MRPATLNIVPHWRARRARREAHPCQHGADRKCQREARPQPPRVVQDHVCTSPARGVAAARERLAVSVGFTMRQRRTPASAARRTLPHARPAPQHDAARRADAVLDDEQLVRGVAALENLLKGRECDDLHAQRHLQHPPPPPRTPRVRGSAAQHHNRRRVFTTNHDNRHHHNNNNALRQRSSLYSHLRHKVPQLPVRCGRKKWHAQHPHRLNVRSHLRDRQFSSTAIARNIDRKRPIQPQRGGGGGAPGLAAAGSSFPSARPPLAPAARAA